MQKILLKITLLGMLSPYTTNFGSTPLNQTITYITPFSWTNFIGDVSKQIIGISIGAYFMVKILNLVGQKKIYPTVPTTKLSNIIGEKPEEFQQIIDMIDNPKFYEKCHVKFPKSLLMYGPPGTGKTELARGLANKLNATFFELSGSEIMSKWISIPSESIKTLFDDARKSKPAHNSQKISAVLFIDELESIGSKRSAGNESGDMHFNQTIAMLLSEMTKTNENKKILIIGATNHKEFLDPALIRPGRFDMHVEITLPNVKTREQILRHYAQEYQLEDTKAQDGNNSQYSVKFDTLALETGGCSGADLEEICHKAARMAARKRRGYLKHEDFAFAIRLLKKPDAHKMNPTVQSIQS